MGCSSISKSRNVEATPKRLLRFMFGVLAIMLGLVVVGPDALDRRGFAYFAFVIGRLVILWGLSSRHSAHFAGPILLSPVLATTFWWFIWVIMSHDIINLPGSWHRSHSSPNSGVNLTFTGGNGGWSIRAMTGFESGERFIWFLHIL